MPRLFFAIATPANLKKELVTLQDSLAEEFRRMSPAPNFKPEKMQNSHCTIRFLGNVEELKIEAISSAASEAIRKTMIFSFECRLATCGVFPNRRHARVFWIGLAPEEPFQTIYHAINHSLIAAGIRIEEQHAFHPHLTLFRFREPYRLPTDFNLPDLTKASPTGLVSKVALIESKTYAEGPEHKIRATYSLSNYSLQG